MVNKIFIKSICFIIISAIISNFTYASEIDDVYERELSYEFYNEKVLDKSGDLLSIKQLAIEGDINTSKKSLNLYKCSDDIQDYISMREVVELIGGNITWERGEHEKSEYNYGYIIVNGKKYKYIYSAKNEYNLKTDFSFLSMFNVDSKGNETPLYLNGNGPILLKLNKNNLLMPVYQLIDLLNRWGYIYTIDAEYKQFKIKKYDFISENELVNNSFPQTDDLLYYNSEEIKYFESNIGEDFYTQLSSINLAATNTIKKYFNNMYKPYIEISDYEERARLCYKGYYYLETANENITVEYNKDLDCYVAYNNRCSKESPNFKMIAIRKFDGQLIYVYN